MILRGVYPEPIFFDRLRMSGGKRLRMSASCQFFGLPMSQAIAPPMAVEQPARAVKSKAKEAFASIIISDVLR